MQLIAIGTSHRLADVARRERLAGAIGDIGAWLDAARDAAPAIAELFVLATCHRIECYTVASDSGQAADVIGRLLGPSEPGYIFDGERAISHLCQVACGLDSVIVGEAEVSGQIRRGAAIARDAATMGPYLERVVAAALRASGRARAETAIGRGVMSAASAGVALAASTLGTLEGRSVVVVGAGQAGRQALARLGRAGAQPLYVASRSDWHARQAAEVSGASVVPLDRLEHLLADVDVVLTAVTAPAPVVMPAHCRARAGRPLLIVDLSMPRAVDPDAAAVPGVTLRTIDDLGDVARASLARRLGEVPRVEAICRDEAARAHRLFRARAARASESEQVS